MERFLLMECRPRQKRLAVLEDGNLAELMVERESSKRLVGNIYLGRVLNILPGMQAAFVDIGLEKNAFLYVDDILLGKGELDPSLLRSELPIEKRIKPGQSLLVQVIKEPGGTKGPRVSTHVTLPGRYLVLLPTVAYAGVSRKISCEAERTRLRGIAESLQPRGMGLIARTMAEGAEEAALAVDQRSLLTAWSRLAQRARHEIAPALIYSDEDLAQRLARDLMDANTTRCLIDDPAAYAKVRDAVEAAAPEKLDCVGLYQEGTPLFDAFGVESKADKALARRVWLKSGGYLVIEPCEALTTIDVNTGKFIGKRCLSDTIFATNQEAAVEIARQLRLRDLGGIVVVDFIDMQSDEERAQILALLQEESRRDRGKVRLAGFTQQGMLELTRKKVNAPLHTLLRRSCPYCHGEGTVLSELSVAYRALRALEQKEGPWIVYAHPEVAQALLTLSAPPGVRAYVCPDAAAHMEAFRVEPAEESALPTKTQPIPCGLNNTDSLRIPLHGATSSNARRKGEERP